MQILRLLLCALGTLLATCLLTPRAMAQDAAPSPTPGTATDLFPSGGPSAPSPSPSPSGHAGGGHRNGGGGHGRTGRHRDVLVSQADADPLEVRVAYRRAKTVAMARDPGLADLLHQADAAPTDVDRRAYLKEYYARLYASVRKIDPSPTVKAHVELLAQIAEQRYDPKRREVGGDEDLVNGGGRGRKGRIQ